MQIGLASSSEIDGIWPQISAGMQKACDTTGGSLCSADLWQMCRAGDAFLMIAHDDTIKMASVWRFENWPSGTVFKCLGLCGQDIAKWLPEALEYAKQTAKSGNASRIIAEGRFGWERVARQAKIISKTYEVNI